eukprot:scaffold9365_cov51-Attheya_sp.AAC.3
MDAVTIQVEDVDIKVILIKEEDLMDRIIVQGSLLDLMEQQAVVAVENDAANNAGYNNNAPSAASTVTNHTNASGWGAGNQSANNAAVDNHWMDSVGAPE